MWPNKSPEPMPEGGRWPAAKTAVAVPAARKAWPSFYRQATSAMIPTRALFSILMTVVLSTVGCVSTTNPLAGWRSDGCSCYVDMNGSCQAYVQSIPYSKAVSDDVLHFIARMPRHGDNYSHGSGKESNWIFGILLFKDGASRHAVEIETVAEGLYLNYVLIYDKDNQRIKVLKFTDGDNFS